MKKRNLLNISTAIGLFLCSFPVFAMEPSEEDTKGLSSSPVPPPAHTSFDIQNSNNNETLPPLIPSTLEEVSIVKLDDAELGEIFPHIVEQKIGETRRYMVRELTIGAPVVEQYTLPNNINNNNIHEKYLSFKKLNERHVKYTGIPANFSDNSFYYQGQKAHLNSTNVFKEGFRYVVDENFNLYINNDKTSVHTNLLGGQYVLCAGILNFNEDGKISYMSHSSGHYQPAERQLQFIVGTFAREGKLANDATVGVWDGWGDPLSWQEFLQKKTPPPIKEIEEIQQEYDSPPCLEGSTIEEDAKSLTRKIFDILHHADLEAHFSSPTCTYKFGADYTFNRLSLLKVTMDLSQLMRARPHQDLYQKVLDIKDHFFQEDQEKDEGRHAELKAKRPHTKLWKEIFGESVKRD